MRIRNLPFLRSLPFGDRLVESLQDLQTGIKNISQQINAHPDSQTQAPPPQINALKVTASGGVAHVQVIDNNAIYRGIEYHVQYSTDPSFSSPVTAHMGPSRDIRIPVGAGPLYYRAFSDYQTSSPSTPVYHGGQNPLPIAATGTTQPEVPAGQGSGTGMPGQLSGYGPIPFRGNTPPKRS